jgi:hypothetical protein
MLDCLTNLVGLTRQECSCFDGDLPADYDDVNASESGLFITDNGDGFPLLEAVYQAVTCGDGNIYEVLQKCRDLALIELDTNLKAALTMTYKGSKGFRGAIARTRVERGVGGGLRQYAFIQLRPQRLRDASMMVNAISTGFTATTGSIDVTIRCSVGDDLFTPVTVTLNAVAGKWVRNALDTPINLPFYYESYPDPVTYYFYYDVAGQTPMANTFTCCGYRPDYLSLISAGGGNENDIESVLQDWDYIGSSGYAYGLSIEGYSQCDTLGWVCEVEEVDGFSYRNVLAKALQLRSAAFLAQYVLDSPNTNLFTTARRENIYGKRNHFIAEFNKRITWLSQNVPHGATDCLGCKKPRVGLSRRSL